MNISTDKTEIELKPAENKHVYVSKLSWERIYLDVTLEIKTYSPISTEKLRFFLVNEDGIVETEFLIVNIDAHIVSIRVNVTNSGVNRCLINGTYRIVVIFSDGDFVYAECSEALLHCLANRSRCFRYNAGKAAYTINFMIEEVDVRPSFLILICNMKRVSLAYVPNYVENQKQSIFFKTINILFKLVRCFTKGFPRPQTIIKKICQCVYDNSLLHVFKKKSCILFLSERQTNLAPNMQCLYERMKERGMEEEFSIIFSLRSSSDKKQTLFSSIKCFSQICLADFIIVDDYVPWFNWLLLNPSKTKLIQIWHAGAGFKGIGFSRWGHFGCPGPFNVHRQYTFCTCDSNKIKHFFSEQFGILDEQVIPTGMPRLDKFLDDKNIKSSVNLIYKKYPQFSGKKVILFAPTYRGRDKADAYYPFELLDFKSLYEFCLKKNAIILFKPHPWVNNKIEIPSEYHDFFYDLSDYYEINNLFYITDVFITDYSSCMYEYALLNKPMLAYAFDLHEYASSRGFHRAYEENVPGKICLNFQQLLRALEEEDYEFTKHKAYIEKHFDNPDIHNSDRFIDWLIYDKLPERYKNDLKQRRKRIRETRGRAFMELLH